MHCLATLLVTQVLGSTRAPDASTPDPRFESPPRVRRELVVPDTWPPRPVRGRTVPAVPETTLAKRIPIMEPSAAVDPLRPFDALLAFGFSNAIESDEEDGMAHYYIQGLQPVSPFTQWELDPVRNPSPTTAPVLTQTAKASAPR